MRIIKNSLLSNKFLLFYLLFFSSHFFVSCGSKTKAQNQVKENQKIESPQNELPRPKGTRYHVSSRYRDGKPVKKLFEGRVFFDKRFADFWANAKVSRQRQTNNLLSKQSCTPQPSLGEFLRLKFISGVRSILHDSKGNYWFGSHREGVALFDGKSFQYFTIPDGLGSNQVRSIQEDNKGNIWFGTSNGVSSYNGQQIIKHPLQQDIMPNDFFQAKWTKTNHDLWFNAGESAGVYKYDGQGINYLEFPNSNINNSNNPSSVTGITKGKNDQLWIATYSGIFGFDGSNFTIINNENLGRTKETGYLHVRSILEDRKGNLWIGNNGIGVLLFDGNTTINFSDKMKLISLTSLLNGAHSPSGTLEHVFAIGEDQHGNIWFGDRDTGAWKYDGQSIINYNLEDGLPVTHIWHIYQDRNGELLFAMDNGSVYVFTGNSFERRF